MKKLSILLVSLVVSIIGWSQTNPNTDWKHANPFAYDLRVTYSADMQTINFSYTLNDDALKGSDADFDNDDTRGVQVFVYDKNGNKVTQELVASANVHKGTYSFSRSASLFQKDQPYTWEVITNGNAARTLPQLVTSVPSGRPNNAYGIAINNLPSHVDYGRIYVSEAYNSRVTGHNSFLLYSPMMTYVGRHDETLYSNNKVTEFSTIQNREPNRVKVSEDGRVFLSSYNPTGTTAVWEYLGAQKFRTVIYKNPNINKISGENELLARRVIGMDIKGEGENLKILLAWIDANGYNDKEAKIELYEYALGEANKAGYHSLEQIIGQGKTSPYVRKVVEYNCDEVVDEAAGGVLYQSFAADDYSARFGFVDVTYDVNGNIWMKIDYADQVNKIPGKIVWIKGDGTELRTHALAYTRADGFYGGSAVIVTKDNVLFTAIGDNTIQAYDVNASGDFAKKDDWTIVDGSAITRIGRWVTGFALDRVNNLYAATEAYTINDNKDFTANIVTIALPYEGKCSTISSSKGSFVAPNTNPIPNICATNLRYKYTEDRLVFSFKVNTKPKVAQIRFYDSKANMQNSANAVHSDSYDGSNIYRPAFVYNIPASKLRTGLMKIELGMCNGKLSGPLDSEGCEIINDSLPAGEWYWSVYVEAPRRSTQFAATYKQPNPNSGVDTHYRLHAAVNTYPETDGFGEIYVAQYNGTTGDKGLMVYGFHPNNNFTDEDPSQINTTKRYSYIAKYVNPTSGTKFENQRRLAVAPDGKVYIADHGATNFNATSTRPMMFTGGGIYVWDPSKQSGSTINLQLFLQDATETSSGVAIWNHNGNLKLYGMNTYGEFGFHSEQGLKWKGYTYDPANQADVKIYGWNGFKEYVLGTPSNVATKETMSSTVQRSLGMGDGNGNISIAAMDKGVWLCQHREQDVQYMLDSKQPLPDNLENYILSFVPYQSSTRTWTSTTSNGVVIETGATLTGRSQLTQYPNSPVQAAPGAGCAYRKYNGKEYIYMVQHTGDIAVLQITGWTGSGATVTPTVKYIETLSSVGTKGTNAGGRTTGTITSMCFDYAGNLVTTAGATYFGHSQDLIVYTMPYPNRVNAQEIQAPSSCVFIPERLSQEGMNQDDVEPVVDPYIISPKNCTLDFYRTLQTGSYNSICLPFDVTNLSGTPYEGADVMQFASAQLKKVGGEQHLYFNFEPVTSIEAGVPYLIQPKADVNEVVQFTSVRFEKAQGDTVNTGEYADFIGTFAQVNMDEPTAYPRFMVVAENRLAEIDGGTFRGFRSYFQMKKDITNTISLLNFKKPSATSTEMVVDGKTVDVEKLIREGRVYIRVGETLYSITGEVVGR